jgi:ABC-type multidrug transport system ATPase subunit
VNPSPPDSGIPSTLLTDPDPVVVLRDVSKQFGRFAALRGVTASFAPGKMYAILGDNGAGKTTLLRIMVGLSRPTRGAMTMLGSPDLRSVLGAIGYMAHPSLLYDELSGIENLRYFASLYGIADEDRCAAAIATVGLDPLLARHVGQYSQGMRQRISLARALLHDPRLLLLDEPFSNVDVGSAHAMVRVLAGMRDAGKTVFIITHQAALLDGVADEFVRMEDGVITAHTRELRPPGASS